MDLSFVVELHFDLNPRRCLTSVETRFPVGLPCFVGFLNRRLDLLFRPVFGEERRAVAFFDPINQHIATVDAMLIGRATCAFDDVSAFGFVARQTVGSAQAFAEERQWQRGRSGIGKRDRGKP